MPAATRKGDHCTGHGGYPPRQSIEGSATVFINGIPAHRSGDRWAVHCTPNNCHDGVTSSGSASVFIEGKAAARIGDDVSCGSAIAKGSSNVFVG